MIASKKIRILVDAANSQLDDLSSKAAAHRWCCDAHKNEFNAKLSILRAMLKSVGDDKDASFAIASYKIENVRVLTKGLSELLKLTASLESDPDLHAHMHTKSDKKDDDDLLN